VIPAKLREKLGLEEGTLAILQTYFDINEEKHKRVDNTPDLALIRKSLFWDTDIAMIDWDKHYKAVIRRIFERGNENEKQELIHFYGAEKINTALYTSTGKPYTIYKNK
jgi:bifunctional DNA-binding transcriptional regulator/antitoxin component of YhaV-PrlF toxin-antitoxin module